jgi:uncharacterized protein (DUF1697 family)
MTTFVSILRGINVGKRKVLMADLKMLYEQLGFTGVVTYIQSGNVIFNTNKASTNQQLAGKIEKAISQQYHFDVPVINRTVDELKKIISANPFSELKGIDNSKLHVTFLAGEPKQTNIDLFRSFNFSPDKFFICGSEIFLHIPGSYAETRLSNKFFENKLELSATTRNWNTVTKLVELAEAR